MWLYKTSNIAQVRTSYKFFLDEKPDNSKIFAAVLLVGKRYIHTYILYWLVPTGLFRVNFTLQNYKPSTMIIQH